MGQGLCTGVGTVGVVGTELTLLLESEGEGRMVGSAGLKVILSFDRYSSWRTSGRRRRVVRRRD